MFYIDHRGNRTDQQEKYQEERVEKSLGNMKDEFIKLGGHVEIDYSQTENNSPKVVLSMSDGDIGAFLLKLHSRGV